MTRSVPKPHATAPTNVKIFAHGLRTEEGREREMGSSALAFCCRGRHIRSRDVYDVRPPTDRPTGDGRNELWTDDGLEFQRSSTLNTD